MVEESGQRRRARSCGPQGNGTHALRPPTGQLRISGLVIPPSERETAPRDAESSTAARSAAQASARFSRESKDPSP